MIPSPNLEGDIINFPNNSLETATQTTISKPPREIATGLFAFAPNRETLGATAYFILENTGNILIDCPAWEKIDREFIKDRGGIASLVITHRGGISQKVAQIQAEFGCEVIIQEQEAYLIPEAKTTLFSEEYRVEDRSLLVWTAGHSPGSSCLYWQKHGGVLFTGRHLLPISPEKIQPLRVAKTFHWWRQLQSVQKILDRFSPETLQYICPAANTGYLRGGGWVADAYQKVESLDFVALRESVVTL
jgi:glyoxylase-like metal-dependent hydrolase (beta-lactamase superfamily II)